MLFSIYLHIIAARDYESSLCLSVDFSYHHPVLYDILNYWSIQY